MNAKLLGNAPRCLEKSTKGATPSAGQLLDAEAMSIIYHKIDRLICDQIMDLFEGRTQMDWSHPTVMDSEAFIRSIPKNFSPFRRAKRAKSHRNPRLK